MKTYLAIFLVGCALGALVNGWRLNANMADLRTAHSDKLKEISDKALQTQQSLQAELDANEKLWATAEAIQYQTILEARNEIDNLRDAVNDKSKQLLVNATCSAAGSDNVSETGTDSSLGERAAPRLTKDAEPYYYTLIEQIVTMTAQLNYYQARCE
ncbi:hypothetical protein GCM10007891_01170 [Methylophaga thalassica]|uniref:Lysis protein n=1 Tax=Methylophaga thalassica TaxID=40223 RepID=A0ABQ5TQ40_9GAMM|nr:lysis system i-spanin subunit Rz [Methylophaga thalassica]GLP98263.1 hypothetical protein GCM10007891_01170 [Methylophaga thalassica]